MHTTFALMSFDLSAIPIVCDALGYAIIILTCSILLGHATCTKSKRKRDFILSPGEAEILYFAAFRARINVFLRVRIRLAPFMLALRGNSPVSRVRINSTRDPLFLRPVSREIFMKSSEARGSG